MTEEPTTHQEQWNRDLAVRTSPPPLLQSWGWGEVQSRAGWAAERVSLPGGGRATVLVQTVGPFKSAYVPRGPVPADEAAVREVVAWARERGLHGIRVEPEAGRDFRETLQGLGMTPAQATQPLHTAVMPLADEETLLASFAKKTRYSIRKSAEVTVEEGTDVESLHALTARTSERRGINLPRSDYYRLLVEHLPGCRTYVARYQGEVLAANLFVNFEGRSYYLYAGSSGARSDLNPAYAALWAAMLAAHREGCRDMDLWGMPASDDPADPWAGIGRFKTGFGGVNVEFCGAYEQVLSALPHRVGRLLDQSRQQVRRLRAGRGR